MKTKLITRTLSLLLLSIALLTFSNCDKILEAFDIESPFSKVFPIEVGPDDDLVFMETETINLNNNEDFANNKDNIDKFNIVRVYYKIVSYEGADNILGSGTLTFFDENTQVGDAVVASDVNFSYLLASQDEVTLDISDNTKNALAALIKDKMKFTMVLEGLISDKPAYIDVEIFVVVSANVKP